MATYLEDALAKSVHVIDKIVVVALLIIALHDLRQTNQKARQSKDHEKEMIDRERATRTRTDWAAWRSMFITTSRYLSKLPPKKWRVRLQEFNQQFMERVPMERAISPKHERIGGFTARSRARFCRREVGKNIETLLPVIIDGPEDSVRAT